MARKFIDCREYPSESKCSLRISGEEEEVVRCASRHAADVHGEKDGPELRDMIRRSLHDEFTIDSISAAQL